ncbi:MAG: hypothetical protein GX665_05115 [Gammaproteobacteria bacterium]|nr:hypothetical protein [Gammaproteobacteria bacterium]
MTVKPASGLIHTSTAFAVVVSDTPETAVIITTGTQGPPGPPGIGGADIDPNPDNQIEARPSGLFVKPSTWAEKEW